MQLESVLTRSAAHVDMDSVSVAIVKFIATLRHASLAELRDPLVIGWLSH